MEGYTFDVESIDLTGDEMRDFATIVRYTCLPASQNQLSCFLAMIERPQGTSVQEFVSRQVEKMWRTDIRV
jgi:hypothetical protein